MGTAQVLSGAKRNNSDMDIRTESKEFQSRFNERNTKILAAGEALSLESEAFSEVSRLSLIYQLMSINYLNSSCYNELCVAKRYILENNISKKPSEDAKTDIHGSSTTTATTATTTTTRQGALHPECCTFCLSADIPFLK
ncbi:Hypothetical predicted protein [Octopus vulgaris]|uniref:Uncharacterized protein n=1 Tax=Octopus vulgaris TaxID=6645 RepID=A0AA36EY28_OCTVU|nr:Hypothetical predicted protein [Octopus vulgaris]